jgi:uncharacterized alkaline shock family protein YloU
MTNDKTPLGTIRIAPRVVAAIAYRAVQESYGVVGLAPKNLVSGIAHALAKDPTEGIAVHYDEGGIEIDLYIIVEYGTRITAVANSAANIVRYHVEKTIGLPVKAVNVHVRGLRVSNGEGEAEGKPHDAPRSPKSRKAKKTAAKAQEHS